MGVHVDEARRDQLALGVDLFFAFGRDLADLDDAAILDGDIGLVKFAAVAVGNRAAANDEISHGVLPAIFICCMMNRSNG